jgi:hypothetical protein
MVLLVWWRGKAARRGQLGESPPRRRTWILECRVLRRHLASAAALLLLVKKKSSMDKNFSVILRIWY